MAQYNQQHQYEIVTNLRRQRILVVNRPYDINADEDMFFEDFDAVFINCIDIMDERVSLALRYCSPLQTEKCRYKPIFASDRLKSWLDVQSASIIDGYAAEHTENFVAQKIQEIYGNMRRLNFVIGTDPMETHAMEMIRVIRFAVSRGEYTFPEAPIRGYLSGAMKYYFHTICNQQHEDIQQEERQNFFNHLIDLGYAHRKRHLEKVHTCTCSQSALLHLIETCPKCGSSHLTDEAVIHHFRCAHVAPESAFEWDGELRCPKCKKMLRHIGVDYDKPSSVYVCKECDDSFMYPEMKARCTSCGRVHSPEDLKPLDLWELELTSDGIRAFATNDIVNHIDLTDFYGLTTFDAFQNYIRSYAGNSANSDILLLARYHVYDPDLLTLGVGKMPRIALATRRLYNYKKVLVGSDFLFLCRTPAGNVSQRQAVLEYEVGEEFKAYAREYSGVMYDLTSVTAFYPGEDVEQFINSIKNPAITSNQSALRQSSR